jgi:hypothetical protein
MKKQGVTGSYTFRPGSQDKVSVVIKRPGCRKNQKELSKEREQ